MYKYPYTKQYLEKFWFDETGQPRTKSAETKFELDNFTEYFIHRLSDHLTTIDMEPESDGIARMNKFKDLYIDCMLDSLHEYVKNSYSPP